jgi:hypothetical protein
MNQRTKDRLSSAIPWAVILAVAALFLAAANGALARGLSLVQAAAPGSGQSAPVAPVSIAGRALLLRPGPILRCTLPVAQGERIKFAAGVASPWTVTAPGGAALRTQWESVATWPDGSARIVELLAADLDVTTGAARALAPGEYVVSRVAAADGRPRPGPWAASWAAGAAPTLLVDGEARPASWSSVWHRSGPVAVTRRFFAQGFTGWLTAYTGVDALELSLVMHNGHPGSPDWFFDSIELAGATPVEAVESSAPAPAAYLPRASGGRLVLVAPRGDGYAHALAQRGAHVWRLALAGGGTGGGTGEARALASAGGWCSVDSWERVDAFAAAALRLPDLEYRAAALAKDVRAEWATMRGALAAGSPIGIAAGPGRLDWQHAWNPKYGGVTGGGFRRQWHGVELAATSEPDGLLTLQARMALIMDRHAVAIVTPNGMPIDVDDWCDPAGAPRGWAVSAADARFDGKSDGPFGFAAVQSVTAGGRTPPELAQFKQPIAGSSSSGAYSPIDFQHWDRALCDAEALVQLANDPAAAWWLRMNVTTWGMSMRSKGRLAGALAGVRARPAWGSPWGRAHGHGLRFASMAFAIGDKGWRADWTQTLAACADVIAEGQTPSGFLRRDEASKNLAGPPFNDAFALSKGTEEALLANGALGLSRSAGVRAADLTDAVDRWATDALWVYLWDGGHAGGAPTDYVAIAPKGGPPFSLSAASGAARRNADREEIASPLGSAILLRKIRGAAPTLGQVLAEQRWCGGAASPLLWMQTQTAYKLLLDDCAPLHAAAQMGNP